MHSSKQTKGGDIMGENAAIRARIYARFSSSNQREESIDGQLRLCREHAAREGYEITGEYADRAISGKGTEKRAAFLRMIRDAERGRFDVLLVYKMDRFARNRYDAAMFKSRLKRAGVKVVSVMESIPEGAEGIILESVLDGFAEYYSASLAENIRRGFTESALAGKFVGGQTPYGYRIEDGKYVIDEARAAVVREVFERLLAGDTIKEVFTSLNERGLRTLKGKEFTRGSINSMLNQEKYKGEYVFRPGREDSFSVQGAMPAIISPELWDAVQSKRGRRISKNDLGWSKFPLSSSIVCAHCGSVFYGAKVKVKGWTYYYYRHFRGDNACTCPMYGQVRKEKLEDALFAAIGERVLQPDVIKAIVEKAMALQAEEKEDSGGAVEAELASVDSALENIYKAIEAGLFSHGMQGRVTELEERRETLLAEIQKDIRREDERLTAEQIESFLTGFLSGDVQDNSFREFLMAFFITRIEAVEKWKFNVYMKYAEDSSAISFVLDSYGEAQLHNTKQENDHDGTFCISFELT